MHRPSWSISTVYSERIAAPSRSETEPYQRGRPELDVARRRVFVGSSDRGLYAVRAEDGTVLWRFETLGVVQCEPLYDPTEDVVYFGSNDGALYKVHASDGALIWRFETNAEVARRPVIVGSTVYAVNANDTVLALNRATGARRWSQHRAPALGMEVAGYAGPLVWRGLVYAGFSDGNVTAYDAETGAERWQPVDLSAEAEEALGDVPRYLDVDTTPVAGIIDESPVVFVGSYDGGVYALDADSGNKVWQRPEVTGVSEIVMWHQAAHDAARRRTRRAGAGSTARVHGNDRPLGARSAHRGRRLAPSLAGRRRLCARAHRRRVARLDDAPRPVSRVAARRQHHRRNPHGRRFLDGAGRPRPPRVRLQQQREPPVAPRHAACVRVGVESEFPCSV